MTGSWLDAIQETVAGYASAALEAGGEAGVSLYDQVAAGLARVQALSAEAAVAVEDLRAGVCLLLESHDPASGDGPAAPAAGAGSPEAAGQAGAILGTVRPVALPRRFRVDQAAFAAFLRAAHPAKPAEHAAAATGVPIDTVAKILARESLPTGRTLLAFVAAYGPELLRAVLPDAPLVWLEGARIIADQARFAAEQERIRAEAQANAGRWTLCGIPFGGVL